MYFNPSSCNNHGIEQDMCVTWSKQKSNLFWVENCERTDSKGSSSKLYIK